MLFLSINYHYIESENEKYPYKSIYPISQNQLEYQLNEIGRHFHFINEGDLLNAVLNKKNLPERCCLITFDDGLKCQYEKALPILKRKSIPAIFFVNSLPYLNSKAPLVHKIHYLRSQIAPKIFLKEIESAGLLNEDLLNNDSIFLQNAKETYPYDDDETSKLKFLLNNVLDLKPKEMIVDRIFSKYVKDEKIFCDSFYMNREQILDINSEKDYSIGTHTHSHHSLSHLPIRTMRDEIKKSIEYFEDNIGIKKINAISYPYGRFENVSLAVASEAKSLGLKLGFTTERSFNISINEPLLFSRLDANDVIGGKSSIFFFESGMLKFKKTGYEKRKSFITE